MSVEPLRNDQALVCGSPSPASSQASLTIDTNLFPYDPQHQTFINIYERDGAAAAVDLQRRAGEHTYYLGTTQGVLAVMKTFIPSGIHHILIGPDHILFLVGLLLTGGTWARSSGSSRLSRWATASRCRSRR